MFSLRLLRFSTGQNGSKSLFNTILLLLNTSLHYYLQNVMYFWEYLSRLVILPVLFGEVSLLNKNKAPAMEKEKVH